VLLLVLPSPNLHSLQTAVQELMGGAGDLGGIPVYIGMVEDFERFWSVRLFLEVCAGLADTLKRVLTSSIIFYNPLR
jgi:hypothetical protein